MLWKFSFASGSTLDTLLSRETPPSVEELLDEQDILAECKAQNNKLVTFLSREDSVKSLLTWVTSGLDDLDTEAETAGDKAYEKALASKDVFPPFKGDAAAEQAEKAESLEPPVDEFNTGPLTPALGVGLGEGLETIEGDGGSSDASRARYPQVATEILTSELWTIPETVMSHKEHLLRPFWDAVLAPSDPNGAPVSHALKAERDRAASQFWTDEDEERERKREVIRGLWMRVNASFLQKRTTEMVRFIQTIPNVIERMVARIESPAVQDLLARIIQTEEAGVTDVMSWLGEQRLIPQLLVLLSPQHPPSTHAIVSDLLKGLISVSAPNSSFNPHGGNAMDQQGGGAGAHKDNRLVRELSSRTSADTLVGYMLDSLELSDRAWKGLGDDEHPELKRANAFIVHPLPSIASATSSLCGVCNVVIEIIRRNNSDLAEPYLFNTLRNRLMSIQTERMRRSPSPTEAVSAESEGEDDTRKKMEDVMPELADKFAIVHLANLVSALVDRFGQLNQLLIDPRSQDRVSSPLVPKPLTMERFRVIELYAELLHASNMATLNRAPGTGPDYSPDGALMGGLDGLDKLGLALQTNESSDDGPQSAEGAPELPVTQPRDPPDSSGSTDYSLTESDDVPLSDDEEATPAASAASAASAIDVVVPPPTSAEDAERLRSVMGIESNDHPTPVDEPLSIGERLKQQFIRYRILPTLLDLFFEHANNNFLHHLLYDLLQQILNGNLGHGYNRELVIELFSNAKLVERILDAQRRNDLQVKSEPRKPRLPYMGHISLISEELVKFFARCPSDLYELIRPTFSQDDWTAYVEGSLSETRARDSQPLAGGKPMPGLGSAMGTGSERSDSESDDDDDGNVHIGEPLSRTIAKQADSYNDNGGDDDGGMEQFWRPSNARSAAMDSSDDDDDDADWLRPSPSLGFTSGSHREADVQKQGDLDSDDAWGEFSSGNGGGGDGANPFDDDAFAPSSSTEVTSFEPLTPADWAEAFDRAFESSQPSETTTWTEETEEVQTISMPAPEDTSGDASSWSFGDEDEEHPQGEDLPSVKGGVAKGGDDDLSLHRVERRHSHSEDGMTAREEALLSVATPEEPLGPGVSADARVVGGLIERKLPDGTVVRVPEDDIAVGIEEGLEHLGPAGLAQREVVNEVEEEVEAEVKAEEAKEAAADKQDQAKGVGKA
ncbi:hypothetical protein VHUM_00134 [Vanrija humicola]|uniref:Uncharacterized protein n=1 Tax=Vanrija humicola TaxID=5417 RepID=A0A7D8VB89_VANHU|nr:hypothetical protein VHUM_00134 [Vanrija humicola]